MGHRESIITPATPPVAGLDAPALIVVLNRLLDDAETVRAALRKSRHPFRVKIMQRMIQVRIVGTKSMTDLEEPLENGGADVFQAQPRPKGPTKGRTSSRPRPRASNAAGGSCQPTGPADSRPFNPPSNAMKTPYKPAQIQGAGVTA